LTRVLRSHDDKKSGLELTAYAEGEIEDGESIETISWGGSNRVSDQGRQTGDVTSLSERTPSGRELSPEQYTIQKARPPGMVGGFRRTRGGSGLRTEKGNPGNYAAPNDGIKRIVSWGAWVVEAKDGTTV